MDIYSAYMAINKSLIESLKAINTISLVEEPDPVSYVRVEESPYVLTEETRRVCGVVSAHKLEEYRNAFYSIKLKDSTASWLLDLLEIDEDTDYAL